MRLINLEKNLPSAVEALALLRAELSLARLQGEKLCKVIHGYGSQGKGGVLKKEVQAWAKKAQREGKIRTFCSGENFHRASVQGQTLVAQYPELKQDRDFGRQNDGITILFLR